MEVYFVFCILLHLVTHVHSKCYELQEDKKQFMKYDTELDFTESSDFELSFKTTADDQILYYCQTKIVDDKDAMDYEGLYIYEGFLNYFIFNPTPYGTGSSRGGHVKTDFEVNNGTWVTVEFFRNKKADIPARFSGHDIIVINQTGMVVNGNKFTFDGTIEPLDIRHSNLYIGGHEDLYKIESRLVTFDGYIDKFKDLKSNTELVPEPPADRFESDSCDRGATPPIA